MTHTGGETFRNREMWKPKEAKRRKMSKMLIGRGGGGSKKRAHTPTSYATSHLIGTKKMDTRKLRKRRGGYVFEVEPEPDESEVKLFN